MKSIIFNTEMVKAVLDGRKTEFRESFSKKQLKYFDYAQKIGEITSLDDLHENDFSYILDFSKYKVDDILYVRETFKTFSNITMDNEVGVIYKADNKEVILPCNGDYECEYVFNDKWKPSVHMPKKYARIFLKVTNVRVERLQDIGEDDLEKEGIVSYSEKWENMECKCTENNRCQRYCDRRVDFIKLWNSTAKDGCKWEDNPYVFVYEFERINKEDQAPLYSLTGCTLITGASLSSCAL